tara:strand:+ start:363 stop:1112 length:750 start_codon:yes stop_codon:yes gene_type:complete
MNIVLFGATGGIGKCLSYDLVKDNNLFIGSRNLNQIDDLMLDINDKIVSDNLNYKCSGDCVDVTDFNSISLFFEKANDFLGSIDCIINCVGSLLLKPAHLLSETEILDTYKTNVFSCFAILKHSFPYLKNNGGKIIFFSSSASKVGLKNHEAISSAKAAVSSLALSSASTYSRYGIRVNAVAPGLVDTGLTKNIINNKMSLEYSKKLHGLNKIGNPENFIPIIRSLIDDRSDWISGQTFFIDGGLSNIK